MDGRIVGLGVVLFIVFWAFQVGFVDPLGPIAWVLGVIIFSGILWSIGKISSPKPSADMQQLWMFATIFVVVLTILYAFVYPFIGAVMPAGVDMSDTSGFNYLMVSLWLTVFGGAMVLTGLKSKESITGLVGIIWVLAALHMVITPAIEAPNAYLNLAIIAGIPFIISGIMKKR